MNRNINNISHLENIFLKIIKDNAKLTLDAMMLELQQKKKEEVILQKDFEEQETIEEIREKFRKRAEHLTVTKKHIFEDELLNE